MAKRKSKITRPEKSVSRTYFQGAPYLKWFMRFQVYKPLNTLPRPNRAAYEIVKNPFYYCEGRKRNDQEMLFKLTIKGRGIFQAHNKEHKLTPGTCFLCRTSDPNVVWYYPPDSSEPWEFIWINFSGSAALTIVEEMNQRYGYTYHIPVDCQPINHLTALAEHNQKLLGLSLQAGSDLVTSLLTSLIASGETEHTLDPKVHLIRQSQEMMVEYAEQNLSTKEIAERVNLSREHFSRLFKEVTGIPPGEFALQQKMLLASQLLKETQMNCKEIADRLGYSNSANFNRAFQTSMGTSPTCFRKKGNLATL